jgi:hypothetical protein
MFPRLREQLGTALDLIVEFSTLGEYRLDVDCVHGAPSAPAVAPSHGPQMGGARDVSVRAAVRRTVAGGATGIVPVATPAARRLAAAGSGPPPRIPGSCRGDRRRGLGEATSRRSGERRSREQPRGDRRSHTRAPAPPEQLCLAV